MSRAPSMTTTSYAILGLLAVKPWTTHELVQQVDRSLRRLWPRAQSKLYEEPKKLVAHGYAKATDDSVGRRRRTRYTITAKGRRALAAWLQEPGDGPGAGVRAARQDPLRRQRHQSRRHRQPRGDPGVGAGAEQGEPGRRPRLPRRTRPVPATGRAQPAPRTVPHRVLRHRRPLGGLGHRHRRAAGPTTSVDAPFDAAAAEEGVALAESVDIILGSPTPRRRSSFRDSTKYTAGTTQVRDDKEPESMLSGQHGHPSQRPRLGPAVGDR